MAQYLGHAARSVRVAAGLTLLDVALQAEVAQSTLSRFERGDVWSPYVSELIESYARLCGVTAASIWRAALDCAYPDHER